jgi:hypothetical protein
LGVVRPASKTVAAPYSKSGVLTAGVRSCAPGCARVVGDDSDTRRPRGLRYGVDASTVVDG